jgi:hypothetical protein
MQKVVVAAVLSRNLDSIADGARDPPAREGKRLYRHNEVRAEPGSII